MQLTSLSLGMTRAGLLAFTPAVLFGASEPGVWFDPSDFSTMFQDSAGTTPVTAVEQPVGRIVSKVNGHVATQATSASRPVLKQDAGGRYCLNFDGVDDSLATGSINFTGTDKMTVFAGVHKTGTATGIVVELGPDQSVGGRFYMAAPESGTEYYSVAGHGSALLVAGHVAKSTTAGHNAPHTGVLTGTLDIAGDLNALRVNGTQAATAIADQGTGNFTTNALYIGRRNNASLPFNGRLYGLIIPGRTATAAEIAQTESWLNGKTGAY